MVSGEGAGREGGRVVLTWWRGGARAKLRHRMQYVRCYEPQAQHMKVLDTLPSDDRVGEDLLGIAAAGHAIGAKHIERRTAV